MMGFEMKCLIEFEQILKKSSSLSPYTFSGLPGVCEYLAEPRSKEELAALYKACLANKIPFKILGNGCNLLVRSAMVSGVVVKLTNPVFCGFENLGNTVRMGAGASIFAAISFCSQNNMAGFETLIGIPGTIGGALLSNTSDKSGPISRFVRKIEVLDSLGNLQIRDKEEISFSDKGNDLRDLVILSVEFAFEHDKTESIVKRLRKAWISRKIQLPLGVPYTGKIFKNPRGLTAASLMEQGGFQKARVGGAEICDRDSNYIVIHPNAVVEDVLRLIEQIKQGIRERFNVDLELEIAIW